MITIRLTICHQLKNVENETRVVDERMPLYTWGHPTVDRGPSSDENNNFCYESRRYTILEIIIVLNIIKQVRLSTREIEKKRDKYIPDGNKYDAINIFSKNVRLFS